MQPRRMPRLLTIAAALLVLAAAGWGAVFVMTKGWQRAGIDERWARKVVAESLEVRNQLERYREAHGGYPESLAALGGGYLEPTSFAERDRRGRWDYRRLGDGDYQLSVTAAAFVSSHDALVYRRSQRYPERWFRAFDASHAEQIGGWYYITGFSAVNR